MRGSVSCPSSQREGFPTVSGSLVWVVSGSWFFHLHRISWPYQLPAELSDISGCYHQCSGFTPSYWSEMETTILPFLCCHVKMAAVILSTIWRAVVNHSQSILLPYQCSMCIHKEARSNQVNLEDTIVISVLVTLLAIWGLSLKVMSLFLSKE